MAKFEKGDVVTVIAAWEEKDGSFNYKYRPAIIFDIIGEDHYHILLYRRDKSKYEPGFMIDKNSKEGMSMNIKENSFVAISNIIKIQKVDIKKYIGRCPDEVLFKIEKLMDENSIKKP